MSRLDLVQTISLGALTDERGALTVIEGGQHIPFEIKRVYYLYDIRTDRGGHAHRDTQQFIVALAGSFVLELTDGTETRRYPLNNPSQGVCLVPMLFLRLLDFAPGTVVMVLASTHYDAKRTIRSWETYLEEVKKL